MCSLPPETLGMTDTSTMPHPHLILTPGTRSLTVSGKILRYYDSMQTKVVIVAPFPEAEQHAAAHWQPFRSRSS